MIIIYKNIAVVGVMKIQALSSKYARFRAIRKALHLKIAQLT